MGTAFRFFVLALALVLLPAGCPLNSDSGPRFPGDGSSSATIPTSGNPASASSTPTSGSTALASVTANAVADGLTLTFPDCQQPVEAQVYRTAVLALVNQERVQRGLDPVTTNATLESQAEQYACELIQYDYFDHVNPVTGSHLADRAADFGYAYWNIGENLAAGYESPARVMEGWMNSPAHRDNILNPAYTELGIAVRVGGSYGLYWVQEFGRPYSAGPWRVEP